MQYLGGKHRIAKELARIIAPRGPWLEPFCGGQHMSVALAEYAPGVSGDVNAVLISLYRAVRAGWQPPETVSRETYASARVLPDSDPLKAFAGFGCSFGAKFFGGYAPRSDRNYAAQARRALLRDAAALAAARVHLTCASFFDYSIQDCVDVLYCDPPYRGTTGYSTGAFDHDAFWSRCREWAAAGVRVYVSEYTAPGDMICVFTKNVKTVVGLGAAIAPRVEKMFQVPCN